jgi:hypothetical protein
MKFKKIRRAVAVTVWLLAYGFILGSAGAYENGGIGDLQLFIQVSAGFIVLFCAGHFGNFHWYNSDLGEE